VRNNKGFTLIELMIVVIILGVLAAILIPRFMGAQNDARINAATADVSLIREGLGLYFVYEGHFPPTGDGKYAAIRDCVRIHVSPPVEGKTFVTGSLGWLRQASKADYEIEVTVLNVSPTTKVYASADTIYHLP